MRFRAVVSHPGTFLRASNPTVSPLRDSCPDSRRPTNLSFHPSSEIVQSISKLSKKCLLHFSDERAHLICCDETEGGVQVWSCVLPPVPPSLPFDAHFAETLAFLLWRSQTDQQGLTVLVAQDRVQPTQLVDPHLALGRALAHRPPLGRQPRKSRGGRAQARKASGHDRGE